jgi:Holliday junction resolvasome RuvABC ATP-dependent DNA helicase subunit
VLEAEVARKQADIILGSGADSNKIYYSVTYPPTTFIATITEAGMLTAAIGGTLFNRATFAGLAVGQVDALTIVWTISFA